MPGLASLGNGSFRSFGLQTRAKRLNYTSIPLTSVFLLGGGGGGGAGNGGGGGASGIRHEVSPSGVVNVNISSGPNTYVIVVGGGGAGGGGNPGGWTPATNGGNSGIYQQTTGANLLATIAVSQPGYRSAWAVGGGYGGGQNWPATNGGRGGGGGGGTNLGQPGAPGWGGGWGVVDGVLSHDYSGNLGRGANTNNFAWGGGGGGITADGGRYNSPQNPYSFPYPDVPGVSVGIQGGGTGLYYGGSYGVPGGVGGGGGGGGDGITGAGGLAVYPGAQDCGAGDGKPYGTNGESADNNTGSGGGGTGSPNAPQFLSASGGNGGSGLAVIQYPAEYDDAITTGSSVEYENNGITKTYRFKSSGSITFQCIPK